MTAPMEIVPAPDGEQVERLVQGRHHDPHSLLGVHPGAVVDGRQQAVVRVWVPDATSVDLLVGEERLPMERLHHAGLFAAAVPGPRPDHYRFAVTCPDGATAVVEDPYGFVPTLGELDLHLFAEGRHEELWRHLGAQVRIHQGVAGTAFAV